MNLHFVLQMSQTLYLDMVSRVHLFRGCSEDFLSQIVRFICRCSRASFICNTTRTRIAFIQIITWSFQVVKLHEEFFLPGEVILEQGTVVDQIYIVAHGCLVW